MTAKLAQWEAGGKSRVLWLSSGDSLFHRKLRDRHDPMSLLIETEPRSPDMDSSYDACLCELNPEDLPSLRRLYERIRPLIREGGEIVVYVFNKSGAQIKADDLTFCDDALPDRDRSAMYFFGSWSTALLRRSYLHVSTSLAGPSADARRVDGGSLAGTGTLRATGQQHRRPARCLDVRAAHGRA